MASYMIVSHKAYDDGILYCLMTIRDVCNESSRARKIVTKQLRGIVMNAFKTMSLQYYRNTYIKGTYYIQIMRL